MTPADILLIVAIGCFLLTWWIRRVPARGKLLWLFATAAFAPALWGVLDDRWQAGVGLCVSVAFLLALVVRRFWRSRYRSVHYLSGSFLTLLGGVAIAAIYLFPVWGLPAPSGEYAVGVRSFELSDPSRPGVFLAVPDEPRRLLIRVWYPAEPAQGSTPRRYFDAAEAQSTARSMGEMLGFPPFLSYLKHVRTNAYEDAPLLAGARDLPTIFYSHGFGSFLAQNSALMEDLASHGYVVYSVQHTYDSSATVFPDGSVAGVDPALLKEAPREPEAEEKSRQAMIQGSTGATFDERLEGQLKYASDSFDHDDRIRVRSPLTWVADQIFVHDRLQSGEVPESVAPIAAACDLTRTGEMGMSFGGATAGVVCQLDKRCVAGINLDGGDFHFLAFNADLPVPFLMVHSDIGGMYKLFGVTPKGEERSFNDFSYESFEHSGTQDNVHRIEVKEAAHLGLSDFPLFMRRPLRNSILGSTPTDVMIGAQNDLVREFFNKYLRGVSNDFPAAQYKKYANWVVPYQNVGLREWWLAKPEEERAKLQSRIDDVKAKMNWQQLRREDHPGQATEPSGAR